MKLALLSDTHGYHDRVRVPPADVLVFAGDYTARDIGRAELRAFLTWLERQPAPKKVFVAGNHDGAFEKWNALARQMVTEIAPSAVYLQDEGVEIDGVRFWGSPYTPTFFDWYLMADRGTDIRRHWDLIPEGTDVLITHGPAHGFGDWSPFDRIHAGDEDLLAAIKRVKPRVHVCGHFHSGYGTRPLVHDDGSKTTLINASIVNEGYAPVHAPWVFEV